MSASDREEGGETSLIEPARSVRQIRTEEPSLPPKLVTDLTRSVVKEFSPLDCLTRKNDVYVVRIHETRLDHEAYDQDGQHDLL